MTHQAKKCGFSSNAMSARQRLRPEISGARGNEVADPVRNKIQRRLSGRPSKYKEEYAQQMYDFFNIEVEKEVQITVLDKNGKVTTQDKVVVNPFPTFGRFAAKIGVSRDTLHDWATAKNKDGTLRRPEFSDSYARAKNLQEALIVEGGMAGMYDSHFACIMAQRILGWRYKPKPQPEVTVTGANVEMLDQIYKKGIEKAASEKADVIARNKELSIERSKGK